MPVVGYSIPEEIGSEAMRRARPTVHCNRLLWNLKEHRPWWTVLFLFIKQKTCLNHRPGRSFDLHSLFRFGYSHLLIQLKQIREAKRLSIAFTVQTGSWGKHIKPSFA